MVTEDRRKIYPEATAFRRPQQTEPEWTLTNEVVVARDGVEVLDDLSYPGRFKPDA
jgi:hypothetical protein